MNIDKDKLIEKAKEADILYEYGGYIGQKDQCYVEGTIQKLTKFADLVSAHAITSMQTEQWQYFDAVYKKACESSQPNDWMDAALLAQQVRNANPAPVTSMQGDSEAVAFVDESDDGLFIEIIYGENGSNLKLGDKLYLHDKVKGVSDEVQFYKDQRDAIALELKQAYVDLNNARSQLSTNTDGLVSIPVVPTDAMMDCFAGTKFRALPLGKQQAEIKAYKAMINAIS